QAPTPGMPGENPFGEDGESGEEEEGDEDNDDSFDHLLHARRDQPLRYLFEESEHPRGQPGNRGQFGPGHGGGSAKRPRSGPSQRPPSNQPARPRSAPAGGGRPKGAALRTLAKIGGYPLSALRKAFGWTGAIEHAAKEGIAKITPAIERIEDNETRA